MSVAFVASASHAYVDADESERYTFFWNAQSPFSQWYGCRFTVDGVDYNCAEQYMMQQKARELSFLCCCVSPKFFFYLCTIDIEALLVSFLGSTP